MCATGVLLRQLKHNRVGAGTRSWPARRSIGAARRPSPSPSSQLIYPVRRQAVPSLVRFMRSGSEAKRSWRPRRLWTMQPLDRVQPMPRDEYPPSKDLLT